MPFKLKIRGAVFHCGRCRKSYSNPLGHRCVVRNPKGRTRVRPKASASLVTCGSCGKKYSNPLRHVCVVKSDAKKRRAAAGRQPVRKKSAKPARPTVVRVGGKKKQAHDYRACPDKDCARQACSAWKEAWREAWDKAHSEGYAEGRADGHAAGYSAGVAAAAR